MERLPPARRWCAIWLSASDLSPRMRSQEMQSIRRSTAYVYDWNILPIGQQPWLRHLETFRDFPAMQDPSSYNLEAVLQQVKNMNTSSHAGQ